MLSVILSLSRTANKRKLSTCHSNSKAVLQNKSMDNDPFLTVYMSNLQNSQHF